MTKGFLPEVLVACGAYTYSHSVAFSIVLVVLGCLGGFAKFAISFNSTAKRDQLYETASTFIKKIIEKPIGTVDFSSFTQGSDEIH